ncbi:hypothetical protein ACFL16_01010 [Patescibacteria group bacterium]
MRKGWSGWILASIVVITFFDIGLIVAIGRGVLVFNNNLQVPFFVGESLLKVLGLAFLIVNFLFNKDSMENK